MTTTWSDPIALDTETDLIAAGLLAPPIACTSAADSVTSKSAIYAPGDPAVRTLLESRCIVGANVAYDAGVWIASDPALVEPVFDAYRDGRIRDIQLDQRLLDIADGRLDGYWRPGNPPAYIRYSYSLDALHQRLCGAPPLDKDTWRLRYGELIGVPLTEWPEGALQYPQDDAVATLNVHLAQDSADDALAQHATLADSANQARAAFALHLMSCWGLHADAAHADRVIAFVTEAAERARTVCEAGGVLKSGRRSMAAIRDRVIAAYANRPILLTDAGVKAIGGDARKTVRLPLAEIRAKGLEKYVSTDGDVCTTSGDPVLEAVQMYGSAATRLKKATTLRRGASIPLQTRFDVLKETGRTSSKAPSAPLVGDNFQNFARASAYPRADADGTWGLYATPTSRFRLAGPYPTRAAAQRVADSVDVRGCIIPEPGYVLCSVDYASAEAHTWAQVCLWALGESRMADTLNSGKDPHLLFAAEALLSGHTYDSALARYTAKDPAVADARQFAKVPNYGLPGMLGPATFVEYAAGYGYAISMERSEFVHSAWRDTWHEARPYFDWVKSHSDGDTCTLTQFVSGRVRGGCSVPAASNSFFQGLAADGAKSALLPLWRECMLGRMPTGEESPLLGTKPLLFAHDEVIAAVPVDVAHDAAYRMTTIMVDCFNRYTPDVPVHAEPALMTRWHKSAKAVFDGAGRLVPWQPEGGAL